MRKYLLSLLILAWAVVLNGCATSGKIEPPSLNLANLTLTNATLFEQRYQMQFRVENPNPFDLPIDGIAYELELNGKTFAKGVGSQAITVPRYGSEILNVEGTSTLMDILRQTAGMQKGESEHFQYRLKGKLSTSGRQVPFDYKGDVDLRGLTGGQ